MTKEKLKAYIQKDLRKIGTEKKKLKPGKREDEILLTYLTTRQHTFREVLSLL
jgi:hypothetical protein